MVFEVLGPAMEVVLSPYNLLIITVGVIIGMIAGAIPGFTGTNTVALALPFTIPMDVATALVFMAAIYLGANYGGAIPAILINAPGTAGAAATVLDAYPMSQKGLAAQALGISIFASFIGSFVASIFLIFLLFPIADIAFLFGNPEFFVLALFGIAAVAVALGDNIWKGLLSGMFGLFIAAFSVDPTTAQNRLDFGYPELYDGIPIVPVIIGLFAVSELIYLIKRKAISSDTGIDITSYDEVFKGFRIVMNKPIQTFRALNIGMLVGAMPGAGVSVANFISWLVAKNSSDDSDSFGKGNPEGVIASEASNSAVTAGSLVPTLTLGIPGSGTTAVMLAALLLHGVTPGPQLMNDFALEANILMFSLVISTFVMLVFALLISKYIIRIVLLPPGVLVPGILVLTAIGAFAIRNAEFDIWLMIIFGLLAFGMRETNYPLVPLVLGVILGPIAETAFLRSMSVSNNDPAIFFASTVSILLWFLILVTVLWPPISNRLKIGERIGAS